MNHRFGFRFLQGRTDKSWIAQISDQKRGAIIHRRAMTLAQIIDHGDVVSRINQLLHAD